MDKEASARILEYEKIRDLAKARILDMEEDLKKNHGLRTRCGMEVEFFVNNDKGQPKTLSKEELKNLENKLLKSRYVEKLYREGESLVRDAPKAMAALSLLLPIMLGGNPDALVFFTPLAAGMGFAYRHYVTGSFKKIAQYEFVLGDKGDTEKGSAPRMGCFKAAVAVEHMKHVIAQEFSQIGHVTYEAKPRQDNIVSGMHINVSLTDKDGHNILAPEEDTLKAATAQHLLSLQKDASLLFLPSEASLERLKHGRNSPKHFVARDGKGAGLFALAPSVSIRRPAPLDDFLHERNTKPEHSRVENRLPGADADPYLGMVVTLGALCNAVEKKEPKAADKRLHPDMPAQVEVFNNSEQLREVLGEELHKAISEYVARYGDLKHPEAYTKKDTSINTP